MFLTDEMVFFKNNIPSPELKDLLAGPLSPYRGLIGISDLTFQKRDFGSPLGTPVIFISWPRGHSRSGWGPRSRPGPPLPPHVRLVCTSLWLLSEKISQIQLF